MCLGAAAAFQEYGRLLETVTELKYLGRFLTAMYDDWTEVIVNLQKWWKI